MTEIDWTWFAAQIKTWTKWQLMGRDRVYREDRADGLLDELDKQRWKLIKRELKKRGFQYRENKWVKDK